MTDRQKRNETNKLFLLDIQRDREADRKPVEYTGTLTCTKTDRQIERPTQRRISVISVESHAGEARIKLTERFSTQ